MPAQVLWREKYDLYWLMQRRATIGHAAFESEHMSNPHNPALSAWPEEYFNWPGFLFEKLPHDITGKVISLDPSLGRNAKTGDRNSICLMAQNVAGCLFAEIDAARGRDPEAMLTALVNHCRDFRPDALIIEQIAFQELLKEPLERIAKGIGIVLPRLIRDDDLTNKSLRIHRLGPGFSQRYIRLKKSSPGTQLFLDEARDFPVGQTDDVLDSLEFCHRFFKGKQIAFVLR